MSIIEKIEIRSFTFEVPNRALGGNKSVGVGNGIFKKGASLPMTRYAVAIETDDGARGEYVTHWVGTAAAMAQTVMLAPRLIGREAEDREDIFGDCKRELRASRLFDGGEFHPGPCSLHQRPRHHQLRQ
jgi:L-alanine-DL-glutamate epimerase-like enolase superfamily enzyme